MDDTDSSPVATGESKLLETMTLAGEKQEHQYAKPTARLKLSAVADCSKNSPCKDTKKSPLLPLKGTISSVHSKMIQPHDIIAELCTIS